jgi:hypothetical protein
MSAVVIAGNTSGTITLDAPAVAGTTTLTLPATTGNIVTDSATQTLTNKTLTSPTITGALVSSMASSVITSGTSVSASGTSIDFTSIPSWVKRVTVMLSGVSTSGTSSKLIQIGDSGGIEITSYVAICGVDVGGSTATASFTTGYGINSGGAGEGLNGSMTITTLGSNIWVLNGIASNVVGGSFVWYFSGTKTLSNGKHKKVYEKISLTPYKRILANENIKNKMSNENTKIETK